MKGQGLSINVIVVMALAILVLVILALVFSDKIRGFIKGTSSCDGDCVRNKEDCKPNAPVPSVNCDDGKNPIVDDGYCCVKL